VCIVFECCVNSTKVKKWGICIVGDGPTHDPDVYLLNYLTPDLRMEVDAKFAIGYSNYMETVAYLLKQGQVPKPKLVRMCASAVPGNESEYVDISASLELSLHGTYMC